MERDEKELIEETIKSLDCFEQSLEEGEVDDEDLVSELRDKNDNIPCLLISDSESEQQFVDRHRIKKGKRQKKLRKKSSKRRKKQKFYDCDINLFDDISENEMLLVRGASPVPVKGNETSFPNFQEIYSDEYDTEQEILSRRERRTKYRKNRKRQHESNDIDWNGICIDNLRGKCNNDNCNRSHDGRSSRKFEICKFYLNGHCAKKDQCGYMHSDFPCKYYYLGLDCIYTPLYNSCKFAHGKPLQKELCDALLNHIQVAPKHILGEFPRMTPEKAKELLLVQHTKLCKKFGIKNDLLENGNKEPIPSLLNMVIQPPMNIPESLLKFAKNDLRGTLVSNFNKTDSSVFSDTNNERQQRRSRWNNNIVLNTKDSNQQLQLSPKLNIPKDVISKEVLNLKLLSNILTDDQIQKLESFGIKNMEQLSNLSILQMNTVGITAAQISSIQSNALNLEKLGVLQPHNIDRLPSPIKLDAGDDDLIIDESTSVSENGEEKEQNCESKSPSPNPNVELGAITSSLVPPVISASFDVSKFYDKKIIDISSTIENIFKEDSINDIFNNENFGCVPSSFSKEKKLYKRPTMYDEEANNALETPTKSDTDMRSIDFDDIVSGDIDLRTPFLPNLQNFIPAVEIDASLKFGSTIDYRILEIDIPKADYSIIRRSASANEKTVDPRLRRIFLLKELPKREIPSAKKTNQSLIEVVKTTRKSFSLNEDLLMFLQKSEWYKNLNSNTKLMVNQEISSITEKLRKFRENPSQDKMFDLIFITENPKLQQILKNLGIYIDHRGEVKPIQNENNTEPQASPMQFSKYLKETMQRKFDPVSSIKQLPEWNVSSTHQSLNSTIQPLNFMNQNSVTFTSNEQFNHNNRFNQNYFNNISFPNNYY